MASQDLETFLGSLFKAGGEAFSERRKAKQEEESALNRALASRLFETQILSPLQQAQTSQAQAEADLLRRFLSGQGGGEAEGEQPIITGGKAGPFTFTTPSAIESELEQKTQVEKMKQEIKLAPERKMLQKNISSLSSLATNIPTPKPGPGRFIEALGIKFKGFTQEIPQINTYNRKKRAVLGNVVKVIGGETGSRLSDQDVARMEGAFPNPPWDTKDQQILQWLTFLETVNDVSDTYGASRSFKLTDLISPDDLLRAKELWERTTNQSFEDSFGVTLGIE